MQELQNYTEMQVANNACPVEMKNFYCTSQVQKTLAVRNEKMANS